jgi:hypothetical protein
MTSGRAEKDLQRLIFAFLFSVGNYIDKTVINQTKLSLNFILKYGTYRSIVCTISCNKKVFLVVLKATTVNGRILHMYSILWRKALDK